MNSAEAKRLYTALVRARKFDEKVGELYPEQEIKCPVHLSLGQEGSAAGVCATLEARDKVWSGHRCHATTVAKGAKFRPLFAELYGRVTGCSRGKGGSMHFVAPEVGVMGASAIVGASIPLALGSALASKLKNDDFVSVVFLGDGALEQGTFHESMNFAVLHKLPIIFIVENNNLATITELDKRQSNKVLWKHAEAYKMPGFRVDGRKPEEVFKKTDSAVRRARRGSGPTLLEIMCDRWSLHVLTSALHVPIKGKKCPVVHFEKFALKNKLLNAKEVEQIKNVASAEIEDAVLFAKESPYPEAEELYQHI